MASQGEVVQVVEQQRQPIREADGGEEGIEPRLQRVLAQQPPGGRLISGDPELLVGRVNQQRRRGPVASPRPRGSGSG